MSIEVSHDMLCATTYMIPGVQRLAIELNVSQLHDSFGTMRLASALSTTWSCSRGNHNGDEHNAALSARPYCSTPTMNSTRPF